MLRFEYTGKTGYAPLHTLAHSLLHECIIKEYGADMPVLTDSYGRPFIKGDPFYVSLTHCKGLCAAMTSALPCGVDAESIRPVSSAALRRMFSEKERQLVTGAAAAEREFTRLWTLKEAYSKAVGRGLAVMHEIDFADTSPAAVQQGFLFNTFYLREHIISVCVKKT